METLDTWSDIKSLETQALGQSDPDCGLLPASYDPAESQ